jgi:tetratricopeptide (TPR) repeat protein
MNVGNNMRKTIYISILILIFSCKNENKKPNPLSIEFHNKAVEYQMENKIDSAIVFFKKAIEIDSSEISTYESLIKIYWWNKQPELALEILKNVPDGIKESNSILIFKGMTLEKMNKLNEAIELYKKAFNENPEILYKKGKNVMEYIGYLTLQTVIGEKKQALIKFEQLKEKELTESEKQYINSIEPIIRNYKGGGYNAIMGNK